MKTSTVVAAMCLLIMLPQRSKAQWVQTNGPYGGSALSFAVSGTNLIAAAGDGGVYRSTNSGSSWTAINNGLQGKGYIVSVGSIDTKHLRRDVLRRSLWFNEQ